MTVHHTGLETACYAAEKEREGMPPSFKEHGYAPPRRSDANIFIALEYLNKALQSGMKPDTQSWVIKAVRELER